MPGIADLIFSQMQTAGQPRTTTQRTTGTMKATENSPLDLGSLGLLLYFMLSGGNKNPGDLAAASSPEALQQFIQGPRGSYTPLTTPSTPASQQNPLALTMSLLGGMGGLGGTSGLR
jgi:hypothetical protein